MHETVILHPEHFVTPIFGSSMMRDLETQGSNYLANNNPYEVLPVSVVIRTKNDQSNLEQLLLDLDDQVGRADTQLIVVDTESTDNTRDVAREFGAQIVSITQAEFNYPEALNRGFERAENPLVFSLVGHSALATTVAVSAGSNHFKDESVGGVFVPPLPTKTASQTEKLLSLMGNPVMMSSPRRLDKSGVGVMGATNAIFRKDLWEEFNGFDIAFAAGGEDGEMCRRIIDAGFVIDREPLVAVHHSHELGPINTVRQWKHWMSLGKPAPFSTEDLAKRRPDLKLEV